MTRPRKPRAPATLTLDAKVERLRDPAAWPERPQAVQCIETHMSWVFLTNGHAWKLKKPVRYEQLDFRTLEARRHFCEEELRLNRRLANGVYQRVVPLTLDAEGVLRPGGEGTVVDWLVKMKRLRADQMLDWALAHQTATARDARNIAERLAAFHRSLAAAPWTPEIYRSTLREGIDENERELCKPAFGLPADEVAALCAQQRAMLANHAARFDERVHGGWVVEGHGDLRPEHVCLAPPVAVIDCLEFSQSLRTLDVLDEIGYLALECERLGAPVFARALLKAYGEAYGEAGGARVDAALVNFYQSYRGAVRARLAAWHLRERAFRSGSQAVVHWRERAAQYLALAQLHAQRGARAFAETPQCCNNSTIEPPV